LYTRTFDLCFEIVFEVELSVTFPQKQYWKRIKLVNESNASKVRIGVMKNGKNKITHQKKKYNR